MLRVALAVALVLFVGGLGFYFGRSSVRRQFVPPSGTGRVSASSAYPALPDVPAVQTGSGAAPVIPSTEIHENAPAEPAIGLPIANLKISDILDTFNQARGGGERRHEATDIMAPRGTPVLAVDDGVVKKLFTSEPGGLTIYQYDPTERFAYYYAHLDRYQTGIREGLRVRRGDVVGYVGSTGNADPKAPHLHFTILQLGPAKEWWHDTTPINPYPAFLRQFR